MVNVGVMPIQLQHDPDPQGRVSTNCIAVFLRNKGVASVRRSSVNNKLKRDDASA